ncbi:hypothetical protein [Streptomyces sp. NPDC050504]|uniref:hypothetical protein n=1 Tax=Streptomyces sp. NPDC050504 TaxID=3365618 RepID=UPI003792972A
MKFGIARAVGGPRRFRVVAHDVPLGRRLLRLGLTAVGFALAALLVLAVFGDGGARRETPPVERPGASVEPVPSPVTRLTVPSGFATDRGWEVAQASPEIALARTAGLVAYLERVSDDGFRLRTVAAASGKAGWRSEPFRPADRAHYPGLLSLTRGGREYFVAWSYGKVAGDALTKAAQPIVSLDVYDAQDGTRQRAELPWPGVPTVTVAGPSVVVTDGRARAALVDPVTGEVGQVPAAALGFPKGCAQCRGSAEVLGQTPKGLLVGGGREFWVSGAWSSRDRAPAGTDARSGTATALTPRQVLARWHKARGAKRAATHDVWAVHDGASGRVVATAECHKPAIAPGEHPEAVLSPDGRFLVAGNLAFDLARAKGFCFENADGSRPLTLTTVGDAGLAYGARAARNAADALAGGGAPVAVDLTETGDRGLPEPVGLAPSVRLPGAVVPGAGLFRWTDPRGREHLIAYAEKQAEEKAEEQ